MGFNVQPVSRNKGRKFPKTQRNENEKKGKANKRQWDQMEFIFLALKQGVASASKQKK